MGIFLELHHTGFIYLILFGLLEGLVVLLTLTPEKKLWQRNFSNKAIGITNFVKHF